MCGGIRMAVSWSGIPFAWPGAVVSTHSWRVGSSAI